jgi:hypothetical protein
MISQLSSTKQVFFFHLVSLNEAPLATRHTSKRCSISHHVFINTTSVSVATFGASLRCARISWGGWVPRIPQLCLFTMPSKSNFGSSEKHAESRKFSSLPVLCSIFSQSLSSCRLWWDNCKSSKSATWHNRGDCISDRSYVSELVVRCFDVCRLANSAYIQTEWSTKEQTSLCYREVRSLPLYNKYFSDCEVFTHFSYILYIKCVRKKTKSHHIVAIRSDYSQDWSECIWRRRCMFSFASLEASSTD